MARKCPICEAPDRGDVDNKIRSGLSNEEIRSSRFSAAAVEKHRKCLALVSKPVEPMASVASIQPSFKLDDPALSSDQLKYLIVRRLAGSADRLETMAQVYDSFRIEQTLAGVLVSLAKMLEGFEFEPEDVDS